MADRNWNAHLAVVVCTPFKKATGPRGDLIFEPISPLWHRARMDLSFGTNINVCQYCADGMEVGVARSHVAKGCREARPKPEFLLFIDSDVIVPNDSFTKLFYHLKTNPKIDIAAGVYVVKGAFPYDPLIYRDNGEGAYWDWAVGDILTTKQHGIRGVHMGLTLIRVSLFDRLIEAGLVHGDGTDQEDEPFFCTQNYRIQEQGKGPATFKGTEDIYFCDKVRKIDGQILVDTSVLAGHHDHKTGISFGLPWETSPIQRAKWLPLPDGSGLRGDEKEAKENEQPCEFCKGEGEINYGNPEFDQADRPCEKCGGKGTIKVPLKIAIDLGAGESRRAWDGYKTYTTDYRKDSGADYIQPLPVMNLPDDHYDLVASRHSFEHVGRWEQEKLFAECFRICKPGGKLEVIVPNLEWACQKVVAGEMDVNVMNVLYGGQEADTEINSREANVHYFGYTKDVLRALVESAGFVDVRVVDWRDDPAHGYHLLCLANKPESVKAIEHNGVVSLSEPEAEVKSETREVVEV